MQSLKELLTVCLAILPVLAVPAAAQEENGIKLGFAKCAHCTPLTLTPDYAEGVAIEVIGFNTGNDVLTALVSESIDVAQVTYLHYATALDKGFDVVAISGQVNGGSRILVTKDLAVTENDWGSLKTLVAERKEAGTPLKVAASRGNAQDIHMRGAFAQAGIAMTEVEFVNIPNPSDHAAALRRAEVDLIASVEPFASQILQVDAGKFFTFPYDQPAGKLTNLIVTRSDVVAEKRKALEETVASIVEVNAFVAGNHGAWVDVINRVTGLDKTIAEAAITNLEPDYRMYRERGVAIAKMMQSLNYIGSDVSEKVVANMDYSFLEAATGKPSTELGN